MRKLHVAMNLSPTLWGSPIRQTSQDLACEMPACVTVLWLPGHISSHTATSDEGNYIAFVVSFSLQYYRKARNIAISKTHPEGEGNDVDKESVSFFSCLITS